MSIEAQLKRIGQPFGTIDAVVFNRTGATMIKGQVLMLDILGTQTATSFVPSAAGTGVGQVTSVYANGTPVATAGLQSFPMGVLLDDTCANGSQGRFRFYGECEVAVVDDDVGAADVVRGSSLTVANGNTYAQLQATTTRCLGLSFEQGAADSTVIPRLVDASSHRRFAFWNGLGFGCGNTL